MFSSRGDDDEFVEAGEQRLSAPQRLACCEDTLPDLEARHSEVMIGRDGWIQFVDLTRFLGCVLKIM